MSTKAESERVIKERIFERDGDNEYLDERIKWLREASTEDITPENIRKHMQLDEDEWVLNFDILSDAEVPIRQEIYSVLKKLWRDMNLCYLWSEGHWDREPPLLRGRKPAKQRAFGQALQRIGRDALDTRAALIGIIDGLIEDERDSFELESKEISGVNKDCLKIYKILIRELTRRHDEEIVMEMLTEGGLTKTVCVAILEALDSRNMECLEYLFPESGASEHKQEIEDLESLKSELQTELSWQWPRVAGACRGM